jgi:hypothetical protein
MAGWRDFMIEGYSYSTLFAINWFERLKYDGKI